MPTYHRPDSINSTLKTVINQSFTDLEILVRADGIEDSTADVIAALNDPRIRFTVGSSNKGMPGVLNNLIADSRGEYVVVLHDHDHYDPSLVEKMLGVIERNPSVLYVHTGVTATDRTTDWKAVYVDTWAELSDGDNWAKYMLSRWDSPVCAETMVRRTTYEKHGLYAPEYGFWSDVEMWVRLATHGDVGYIAESLIELSERETDHLYKKISWDQFDILLRIREEYGPIVLGNRTLIRLVSTGLSREYQRLRILLAILRHPRDHENWREKTRKYLRAQGGPFTRLLALLIPGS